MTSDAPVLTSPPTSHVLIAGSRHGAAAKPRASGASRVRDSEAAIGWALRSLTLPVRISPRVPPATSAMVSGSVSAGSPSASERSCGIPAETIS